MKTTQPFSHVFIKSLSDTSFYLELRRKGFLFSLKYLFFLLLCLWTVYSGVLAFVLLTAERAIMPEAVSTLKESVLSRYPENLVLTLENGKLTKNLVEPVAISFKTDKERELFDVQYAHWLTIDTDAELSDYPSTQSLALLTAESLILPKSNSSQQVIPLSEVFKDIHGPLTLNQHSFQSLVETIFSYSGYVKAFIAFSSVFAVIVLPIVGAAAELVFLLIYFLSCSLILKVIAHFMKRAVSFGELYRLSMHGITASLLYQSISWFTGFSVPFGGSIILFIWMYLVLKEFPHSHNPAVVHHTHPGASKTKHPRKKSLTKKSKTV